MSCPTCKGYGMITRIPAHLDESKISNWSAFTVACLDCDRVGKERSIWLRSICQVPARYADLDLSAFLTTTETLHVPLTIAQRLRERSGTHWITVWGSPGVGKSLLLAGAVNQAVALDRVAVYVTVPDLLEHLRKAYNPANHIDGDKFWDLLVRADVLALDEVDRFNPTPWAKERFFELVNHRYNEPGLTLFATNRSAVDGQPIIADAPGYFESRVSQGVVLEIKGRDKRPFYREAA